MSVLLHWLIGSIFTCISLCGLIYYDENELKLSDLICSIILSIVSSWIGFIALILLFTFTNGFDWIISKYDSIILLKKKEKRT